MESPPNPEPSPPRAGSRRRRLLVVALIGIVLVGCGWAYREFWLARPVGEGPAGPPVSPEPFRSPWTDRHVLVFGAGDSITAGLGAKSSSHAFFNRLVENPTDEFPEMHGLCLSRVLPNLTVRNTAVSGTNSFDHLDALSEDLPEQPADTLGLVILTTGGNDLIHWYGQHPPREGAMYGATRQQAEPWIQAFERRLNEMLDLIIARFPGGCHIFLADIYDPTDGVGDAASAYLPAWPDGLAIHGAYNDIIRRTANRRSQVHLVPLHQTFLGHGTHCRQFWRSSYCRQDPTYWYFGNIEDPNDRGHDAVRRIFLNEIIRVLHRPV
ncbi:MAG: SGNH/GDSL hydrolase family protein [Planctomycetes bacterium]|nr:SGNH/GDSL hydrolase family protein [Planctomycetota bacterium]